MMFLKNVYYNAPFLDNPFGILILKTLNLLLLINVHFDEICVNNDIPPYTNTYTTW